MWHQIGKHRLLQGATSKLYALIVCFDVKDLTHYFVMTAKKDSLVRKGVLRKDTGDFNKT